ncbi:hypothetical protein D9758_018614 [Tetrapyrgos nigripes]|uniref:Uncharacterized protein n=1 Tax=Tetrapyrgos nigripes TaxID=182062 RepID=A0A8H5FPB6_9AGAR|nr:hypothetical protein D9758_018614 [Tetrapyrgos nigripes]
MAPFHSKVIDPTAAHSPYTQGNSSVSAPGSTAAYFIFLRVQTCEPGASNPITQAIQETIAKCSTPGSKAQRAALQRHTNPTGNLYAMMFSRSEQDRLPIAVKFIEFLCILDDVMEALPYEQSIREHDILCQVITGATDEPVSYSGTSECLAGMIKFLTEIKKSVLDLGVKEGSVLLTDFERTLRQRECAPATFSSLEEYLPYRLHNLDWYFACLLLRWSMNLSLLNTAGLSDFESLTGEIAGLNNDYYSWNREKAHYLNSESQSGDRIMNAVPVLVREHSVQEAEAKDMLKEILIKRAENVVQFQKELGSLEWNGKSQEKDTEGMKQYVEALENLTAGYAFWNPYWLRMAEDCGEVDTLEQERFTLHTKPILKTPSIAKANSSTEDLINTLVSRLTGGIRCYSVWDVLILKLRFYVSRISSKCPLQRHQRLYNQRA